MVTSKMFIELKEKRMEFREKQRREEHEFKVLMVQMFQSGMGGNGY